MGSEKQLKTFSLKVFKGNHITTEEIASYSDSGERWQEYRFIQLPGFDGSQTVNLSEFWETVLQQQITHCQFSVIGRETIVKWSDTQQITEQFTLLAELTFA